MAVQGSETIRAKIAASQTIFADTLKGMARFQSARRVPSVQSLVPAAAKQECVTRADYFAQFTDFPAPYLQYDNGYRSWSYTYAQAGAAARAFSAKLYAEGVTKGDKIILWSENRPSGSLPFGDV
jgi:acyl-CoA synthetase (AMP-forming)/AMP-acid ligase II